MAEFAVASGVAGVISLGLTVCQGLLKYYQSWKDSDKDIARTSDFLEQQSKTLHLLEQALNNRALTGGVADQVHECIASCKTSIERLQKRYEKIKSTPDSGDLRGRFRAQRQKAMYPFKESTLAKLREDLTDLGENLAFALDILKIKLDVTTSNRLSVIEDGVTALDSSFKSSRLDDRRQKIYSWLAPPDPALNHNAACKKREPTTGTWLLVGSAFSEWKRTPNSLLWLYGIPGCGKTVLCSTAIEDVAVNVRGDPTLAIAYFYFDFSDSDKQNLEKLICSLITQLSSKQDEIHESLTRIYSRSNHGQHRPAADCLLNTLRELLRTFKQVFIMVDALDECRPREELLRSIEKIASWQPQTLHMLVTSRKEKDIEDCLGALTTNQICLQSALVDEDIKTHVAETLRTDPKLSRLPTDTKREIEQKLVKNAQGMFRWVECQLAELRKCLRANTVHKTLKTLPKNLDETYARILNDIDQDHRKDALKALKWLVMSARPLRLEELAEALAIDLDSNPKFDPGNRLLKPQDLLVICSSLVTVVEENLHEYEDSYGVKGPCQLQFLRLAHFSVKEYLTSDRIQNGPASGFHIETDADEYMAQNCLAYLLQFDKPHVFNRHSVTVHPLLIYAAMFWTRHLSGKGKPAYSHLTVRLILEFFISKPSVYRNWATLWESEFSLRNESIDSMTVSSSLYYASAEGLLEIVRLLLDHGEEVNNDAPLERSALQTAAYRGSNDIVQLLLNSGADVNAQSGLFGSALQAAAVRGSKDIVQLLLDSGADVNAQGGLFGSALQAAAVGGSKGIVQLLLDSVADINAQDGRLGSALHLAYKAWGPLLHWSYQEHMQHKLQITEQIIDMLLAHGAIDLKRTEDRRFTR